MSPPEENVRRARRHVLVIKGGTSLEHDVSLNSGAQVEENLDLSLYHLHSVTITRTGEWVFDDELETFYDIADAIPKLRTMHIECVFIALHGPRGEDGRIQGLFDMLNIPYVGSGCAASALGIDKIHSKIVARHVGIQVIGEVVFSQARWEAEPDALTEEVEAAFGMPCVVKSPWQGSSLGMGIPQNATEFRAAVEDALLYGKQIMVEKFIEGIELTCGVLDIETSEELTALPVTEIRSGTKGFFDYQAKYTAGASEEITPAEIPDELRDRIQDIALRAHRAIGCRGFSRSDFIAQDNELYWLELNTIPGLTGTSLFPQAAEAAGITFQELVTKLIEAAV